MSKLKPIVTDTYDFPTLIEEGYVYVDKTALLRRMISGMDGRFFFMSRPRRFGKSLMISTLEQIFKGNRKLFRGLDIAKSDYNWKKYPVIRLDMSTVKGGTASEYRKSLSELVEDVAESSSVLVPRSELPGRMLQNLIRGLSAGDAKVVVLVDEYDAPLGGLLSNPKLLEEVRQMLHDFYVVLKAHVADIRFLMMTGVSKFSKLSVFSGLNNLTDLSMRPEYAALLGYTPDELDRFFSSHLNAFAKGLGKTKTAAKADLLSWYDSYRFSPQSDVRVCNPVSIGRALVEKKLEGFWNATGNATLIIECLRKAGKLPEELEGVETDEDELSSCDIRSLPIVPLLYQGGYLTIKFVDAAGHLRLGIPNLEVRTALNKGMLADLFKEDARKFSSTAESLVTRLDSTEDAEGAVRQVLASVFAMVPHEWKLKTEAEAKRYFLLFMKMAGATINAEVESANGRADAIIETVKSIFIFEFKYGKSAKAALKQCRDRNYALPYRADKRQVFYVGLNYKAVDAALEVACEPADGEVSGEVNGEVNSGCGEVKSYVAEHPGCRRREILLAVRLSARTLDRKLATLIAHKMIEFRGAPKTGGYYVKGGAEDV